jgi:hypothetical protein
VTVKKYSEVVHNKRHANLKANRNFPFLRIGRNEHESYFRGELQRKSEKMQCVGNEMVAYNRLYSFRDGKGSLNGATPLCSTGCLFKRLPSGGLVMPIWQEVAP